MGTLHLRPLRCERARRWASLGLDAELSELERAMLARHLDSCADCARFAAEASGVAGALRDSSPELPSRALAPSLRRRDRPVTGPFLRVAAVVAVVVGAVGLAGGAERDGGTPPGSVDVATHAGLDTNDQLRDLRRRELRASADAITLRRDLLLPL